MAQRTIEYSGTYQPDGNSYLAVYGWTRDPLVDYYVIENFGSYDPSSQGKKMGSVSCDGGQYDLYQNQRVIWPGGVARQYLSIVVVNGTQRTEKRTGGTVTTGCHFTTWEQNGMGLGSHDFMIVAVEGYWSSGQATIRVDSPPGGLGNGREMTKTGRKWVKTT
ncbi:hypothetical protein DL766_005469 [Monosporascus sp. MC13-8B]|uniref:Endo-1,4-beta-xylanase n=1 Tax=Monosporascus cannonballus TaxID=155416 RepID=A0ABY0HGK6_9PEZI|nr:hypothetical protein DL762_001348 [Monosporascus cannonballus]RYP00395.1 hypothetical protein DL763_000861 [Monosporascus cannonballus]RYP29258.1 hypothetical protein DL766_005469 [Monosporascus sp. MC13-8B]